MNESEFSAALQQAVLARGLTLDRIVHRLRERGFTLSTATLSYWTTGRSQPERQESLAALDVLETILDLEPGSLRGKLVPRARKSRRKPDRLVPLELLWREISGPIGRVVDPGEHYVRARKVLSMHDRYTLDANGALAHVRTTTVLEADEDDVDHMLIICHDEDVVHDLPQVRPVSGAYLGRVDRFDSDHVQMAELVFDQPLQRGERTMVEHELIFPAGGRRVWRGERRLPMAIRQHVVEVVFDPAALPAAAQHVTVPADGTGRTVQPLAVDPANTARLVLLDPPAGIHGIHWTWP
ncbi:hypothetical protein GCM10010174_18570 [Kutzneria viridogrisea]|uniref:Uncharacterized protein n=2 Tax=Kutzneria TaxID=43356 RepID=W5WFE5_9PSEU|nr:hypothetical protein [Kutzneria albida]AHH99567.1 hypothetical protein KALB_6207 [Kutzneria albida DSM 43870]MBA8922878.1 hypothetical protein [Kutzneria viridogrisea]